jgi:hypothetical protein
VLPAGDSKIRILTTGLYMPTDSSRLSPGIGVQFGTGNCTRFGVFVFVFALDGQYCSLSDYVDVGEFLEEQRDLYGLIVVS